MEVFSLNEAREMSAHHKERIHTLEAELAQADDLLREILDKDKSTTDLIEAGDYLSVLAAKVRAYFAQKQEKNK